MGKHERAAFYRGVALSPFSMIGTICLEVKTGAPYLKFRPIIRQQLGYGAPAGVRRPGGTAASLSSGGSWPWVGQSHLRRWCCSLVPVEEVTAHPPPGSPHYARGRPLFRYGEEENLLSYTTRKKGQMEMLFTDFFSNIFSWPQFRTKQNDGRRFYPRLQPEQSPDSSCRG